MASRIQQFTYALAIAIALPLTASLSHADDTEIFEAIPPAGSDNRPNVLLIVDTSGSMTEDVETQEDWDPNIDFDGNCSDDYIYWTSSGNLPSCSGGNQQRISAAAFVCQSAKNSLATEGLVTVSEATHWKSNNPKSWTKLAAGRDGNSNWVECHADHQNGIHNGLTSGDNKVPRDGNNGPFSSSNEITWSSSNSASYTFYTANRLNYQASGGTVTKSRLEVVKGVAQSTLEQLTDGSINVGLMRFDNKSTFYGNAEGGYVLHEMGAIENVRDAIQDQIDGLNAISYTPLTETMFEAFRYYTGGNVYFGNSATSDSVDGSRKASPNQNTYQSPLGNSCQENFIILLTDGEPTNDTSANSLIEGLTNFKDRSTPAATTCSDNSTNGTSGKCLDDIAQYMYVRPDLETKTGKTIRTYTIGFGPEVNGSSNLQSAASLGGGSYYTAGDTAGLTNAFTSIFQEIFETNTMFTAPTVSVDAFNRTRNLGDLFFAVFQPRNAYHWVGNLKKYRIDSNGDLKDALDNNAVDPGTGFFSEASRSFWSDAVDGAMVAAGGAAHEIPAPDSRNLYTDIAAYSGTPVKDLTNSANAVVTTNTSLTAATLGLPVSATATEIADLINWARGSDLDDEDDLSTTTQRFAMGDPLHAEPASVVYGGTAESPEIVVYVATNDGYLHAIDGSTGQELWSYIPSELLDRLNDLRTADPPSSKAYGLDGSIASYHNDNNNNGLIDGTDKVYLFFGMGRGGNNYYALDVTDKNKPILLWRRGAEDTLIGLGQSWSTPVVKQVRIGSTKTLVVFVAGGYDATQDAAAINTDDSGNRIFMLDAATGSLLWHAGPTNVSGLGYDSTAQFTNSKLAYSIPATLNVVDISGDGLADRMYVGDMGAQIWRFDIHNGKAVNGTGTDAFVTGGVIASLGATSEAGGNATTDARRFYATPDVSLLKENAQYFLSIAIGSGYRGHPLNTTISDRFYALRDKKVFFQMTQAEYDAYAVIKETDLLDVTSNLSATLTETNKGWKIDLDSGEKVLTEATTFDNKTYFTTFSPTGSGGAEVQACVANVGTNKLYTVYARNGGTNQTQRDQVLTQTGIAPDPVLIFPPAGDADGDGDDDGASEPVIYVGGTKLNSGAGSPLGRTYWNAPDTETE